MKKLLLIPLLLSSINAFALSSVANSEVVYYEIKQMNVPVSGKFSHSKIDFTFDDTKLAQSKVSVTLPIKEISVPSDEAKSIVHGKEWFKTTAFPNATFVSSKFEMKDKTHFIAEGNLNIKGKNKLVKIPFVINGKDITGQLNFNRSDFGLGEGDWSDISIVSNDIKVTFKFSTK